MDPVLRAVLLSWDLRAEVILSLVLAGSLFARGWWRLRRRTNGQAALATGWRLAAYLGGLVILGLALMSPIDVLGGQLFFMHMIQHLLLVMIVPPLLLIANPLPFFMWGLPGRLRRQVGSALNRRTRVRRILYVLTAPGLVWMAFVAVFLGWHDPNAYNAALRSDFVHDLEHMTFFSTAMLYWWYVIGAGPRLRSPSRAARLAFLLVTVPVNMAAGVTISFASQPIYTYYTSVPRLWDISVMLDQMIGGVIMWIPGSMMYLLAALILISQLVQTEANKAPLPETEWASDEAMLAPGWKP
ncbi:MAG: cytochrome c oxidase assembly protein [Anaerolineae bacterium]